MLHASIYSYLSNTVAMPFSSLILLGFRMCACERFMEIFYSAGSPNSNYYMFKF
jgi:hypothetical protein